MPPRWWLRWWDEVIVVVEWVMGLAL